MTPRSWIWTAVGVGAVSTAVVGYTLPASTPGVVACLASVSCVWSTVFGHALQQGLPTGVQAAVFVAILWYSMESHAMRRELALQNRIALYDRRMAVYRALRQHLGKVIQFGRSEREWALELLQQTAEATFLFDPEVRQLLDDMYQRSQRLATIHGRFVMSPSGVQTRARLTEELAAESESLLTWMTETQKNADQFFERYLKLRENEPWAHSTDRS